MSYDYLHAFDRWYDGGCKRGQKPEGVERLGEVPGGYKAFMFRHRGKVVVAIGCRRYSLDEARAWWGGIASVRPDPASYDSENRRARAQYIRNHLLKRAARRAAKLGWKV